MPERVRRVALTGGIATGKSYVRARIELSGVPTHDADTLAREVVAPGTDGLAAIRARFGEDVLTSDGTLDRRKLGSVVFADAEARAALEAIVHPRIREATDAWFATLDPMQHPFAVADIPLLYETGRDRDFDAVIVVACDGARQLQRVIARDGLSEDEARQRLAAQLPIGDKVERGDFVIWTDGTHEETDRQVDAVLAALRRSGS